MSAAHAVRLTAGAEADLAEIHAWIGRERGADAADAFLDMLLERVEALERFPLRGAVVPEMQAIGIGDFRQMPVDPYRVIYTVGDAQVTISVIAHARRDFRTLLERRLLGR